MTSSAGWIDETVLIPDLLRATPQARAVLDRYGLRGCGGPLGPVESLAFFAKAHDVPSAQLLQEIREAIAQPLALPIIDTADASDQLADAIYRPFFKAGIVTALTLGAVWGAYLLLRIAFQGSFSAVRLHEVNAHGHAQIFGWVGLFVMGFAYQAFPRFKHTSLAHPRLALASFWMMVAGILCRSVAEPLVYLWPWLGEAAVGAAVLEVFAIGLFVWVIGRTFHTSKKPLVFYDGYILSALAWFLIQAVWETVYLAATVAATEPEQLLPLVATWQGALRDVQIHGFALLMILGVSQRLFPNFFGLPAPNRRLSVAVLIVLNTAVLGETTGMVLMRTVGQAWAALWYASVLLLTGGVGVLVSNWRIFSRPEEPDRSLKFLRAAYLWLFVSLGMLVALPVYQLGLLPVWAPDSAAAQLGFSHAYYGAIRHAITVGFISLMIVGVAAKVVPTLNGVDVHGLSPLWGPFVLINAGCALRVTAQTLTDFTPVTFPIAGISGLLEVTGLALWGVHLWRIMSGRLTIRTATTGSSGASSPVVPGSPIAAGNRVGEVLDHYPKLMETFVSFGFRPLANPLLRKTLAGRVTIAAACRKLDVEVGSLLKALNVQREKQSTGRYPLPISSESQPASAGSGAQASEEGERAPPSGLRRGECSCCSGTNASDS
jgi:hypothetical protein